MMTFEVFAVCVRDWQRRYVPADARKCIESLWTMGVVDVPPGTTLDAALNMVAKGELSAPEQGAQVDPANAAQSIAEPASVRGTQARKSVDTNVSTGKPRRDRGARVRRAPKPSPETARACELLHEQLKHGPRPAAEIEAAAQAAEIPKRVLIAATDELGVRSKRGEWRLPG
jgi:hypothetical protein